MLVLLEAQEENWEEIDGMIRAFQQTMMAMRYADVPVVVAPAGLTLGGGCEITMHGDRVQAAAESYIGLVEVGVGLIPAAGGTKEMTARAADDMAPGASDFLPTVQRAFETVAFAKVSSSAPDAQRLGYLRDLDAYTMNRERLLADAKARALQRVGEGYHPPPPRTEIRVGGDAVSIYERAVPALEVAHHPPEAGADDQRVMGGHVEVIVRMKTQVAARMAADGDFIAGMDLGLSGPGARENPEQGFHSGVPPLGWGGLLPR